VDFTPTDGGSTDAAAETRNVPTIVMAEMSIHKNHGGPVRVNTLEYTRPMSKFHTENMAALVRCFAKIGARSTAERFTVVKATEDLDIVSVGSELNQAIENRQSIVDKSRLKNPDSGFGDFWARGDGGRRHGFIVTIVVFQGHPDIDGGIVHRFSDQCRSTLGL